jgi:peptidyl-prolyl cis-trans isomerase SurA
VITDQDVKEYYEQNLTEYAGEKKYHLRNIFIRISPMATDADRRSARNVMEAILSELKAGKSFDALDKNETELGQQLDGGDLGDFKQEDLSPSLRVAVENMNAGEFTPVLEEPFGYQIVYVEDVSETAGKSLAEAYSEIEDKLFNQIIDQKYQSWLQTLRDRSHVKIIN